MSENSPGTVIHNLPPIYGKNSRILILGTMPSVKSREANFYYMNPHNLFWRVLSGVLEEALPQTVEAKTDMLMRRGVAVWDVLKSCEIEGSLDSTIKNPVPNDFSPIFNTAKIKAVFTAGNKATSLYKRYCRADVGMESIYLPSTSPANRKHYSYERIYEGWKAILPYLK